MRLWSTTLRTKIISLVIIPLAVVSVLCVLGAIKRRVTVVKAEESMSLSELPEKIHNFVYEMQKELGN